MKKVLAAHQKALLSAVEADMADIKRRLEQVRKDPYQTQASVTALPRFAGAAVAANCLSKRNTVLLSSLQASTNLLGNFCTVTCLSAHEGIQCLCINHQAMIGC